MTLNDLRNQIEIQEDILVRRYNYDEDCFDYECPTSRILAGDPILDCRIRYLYSDIKRVKPWCDAPTPMLCVEVESEDE